MSNYVLEEKESFTILGFGVELKSDYTDFVGINQEKSDFLQKVQADGTIDTLKSVASNSYFFIVNEAVNNKMMYYVGVMSKEELPEATRLIQFPKGEYLVVKGEGATSEELSNNLTGMTFGQVLPEVTNVAYVGGANTSVEMGTRDGVLVGEMWIPVVKQ
ncbi:GyrI-like domain-containing protein [Carnobacterium maltaromaticum]|uniref:GyrI-like domain-containing protein n=1 Tax=Carnobacterium maltaromaticum TaxID=2751 RepID=UPI00298BC343|nr:GyrI-like domain-containing protein [Carnobacterium maltaromaticum]MDW5523355.1 GyrI-like domain-containing protein [Carnobacterium maltaromaticum]